MFAIAFDLVVADTLRHHPQGVTKACADVEKSLLRFGFSRAQGSVYISQDEDLANLLQAMNALKALPWLPRVVRDIRVEQWSDFTPFMQQS